MSDIEVIEREKTTTRVRIPSMYKVLLHNDDTTTFDFVILVLTTIFHKNLDESIEITKSIHVTGQGIAGAPYTLEIAKEKQEEVTNLARANGFPLTASFEEL
jgi:ATP-dependent Clp protease adaptor protein ClpS